MKKIVILALTMLFAVSAFADKKLDRAEIYDIEITRVIDGDTVAYKADWLPKPIKPELSIRVYGVDTPEKSWRGQCEKERALGDKASAFTKSQIAAGKTFQIKLIGWDKYGGRVLGDLLIDGKSLRKQLIDLGYARPYFGEKKESWCN